MAIRARLIRMPRLAAYISPSNKAFRGFISKTANSNPINAAEFFHGPFEIVDDDATFLAVKGVGASRLIDERAISFANRFTQRVHVIDAADFAWGDIEEDLREYLTPAILNGVIRMYADQLADFTGHPLSVRRYMWRMEY